MKHIRKLPKGEESFSVAVDGIERAAGQYLPDGLAYMSTWWEWGLGSTPFFWNWPAQYHESLRDGQPHFIVGEFGKFIKPQRAPKTERDGELVRDKVLPVRMRRYIEEGLVRSLTQYFYVPKGLEDIRMVYNGTNCGLNDIIWARKNNVSSSGPILPLCTDAFGPAAPCLAQALRPGVNPSSRD